MGTKFLKCEICGNTVTYLTDSGAEIICCGQPMTVLTANSVDAAGEKHVPVFTIDGDTVHVTVGEKLHPMAPEHYIERIVLVTTDGFHTKELNPGASPTACFYLRNEEDVIEVFAFCNLHGLWRRGK